MSKKTLLPNLFYIEINYFFLVLIPKGKYKGQKLIRLVRIKIAENARSTIASVPDITFVK